MTPARPGPVTRPLRPFLLLVSVLLLLVTAALSACQEGSSSGPDLSFTGGEGGRWPYLDPPGYGVQAFLWWNPEVAKRDVALAEEMGFGWVKQNFAWRDLEGIVKGAHDWYFSDLIVDLVAQADLKLLVRLDRHPFWAQDQEDGLYLNGPPSNLDDFGDFCRELAARYRGRIHAYQVWNEPNLSREWGRKEPNAAEYVELLKVCYDGIKQSDPDALVISAGLAPTGAGLPDAIPDEQFLQQMYDAGAADYFDMLGLHAPGFKAPPELSSLEAADPEGEWGGHPTFTFRHVEDMRAIMVASGDSDKQVAILEMGWTTDPRPDSPYHWHSVTEEQQADYLVRAYQYSLEHYPWVGLLTTIYLAQYDWTPDDEQYWWAITYPDYPQTRVRPAYKALADMPK